jgi:hypothetical protein
VKRHVAIWVGIALALAVSALVISALRLRPGVSMTLLEYRRWPHGAVLRLVNDTRTTIRCLAERNDTPMGSPILCAKKTSNGWSSTPLMVSAAWLRDPVTGKMRQEGFCLTAHTPPKAGDLSEILLTRELRPGQSVDFFVRLERGAPPQRIGTVCVVPQSQLAKKLQPWLFRLKQWCRMQMAVPGQVEVWCPESLCFPPSGEPSRGN